MNSGSVKFSGDTSKAISPVKGQLDTLANHQHDTLGTLEELESRLLSVLRSPGPPKDSACAPAGLAAETPQSPLVADLMARKDTAYQINARLTDIINRLTI